MLDLDIGKAVEGITNVIGQFVEDKDKQKEIEAGLTKAMKDGDIQLRKLELETEKLALEKNKMEAKIKFSLIERGVIPLAFYIFFLILINNSIIVPYVEAFTEVDIPILAIDSALYDLMGFCVGALLTKKVADKSPLVTSTLNNIFKK